MKKITLIISLCLVFSCGITNAQQGGYFGKKSLVEASLSGYPMRWNLESDSEEKLYRLFLGTKINYSYLLNNRLALGLSFQSFKGMIHEFENYYVNDNDYGYASFMIMISGYNIGVNIENSFSGINQRTGWFYRLGIALNNAQIYDYEDISVYNNFVNQRTYPSTLPNVRNFRLNQQCSSFGFSWEIGNRYPIRKNLLFYYSANGYLYNNLITDEYIPNSGVYTALKRRSAFANVLFLNLGLSFSF